MNTNKPLRYLIKTIRENKDMTQKEFSKLLNISQSNLSRMERGDRPVSIGFVHEVASKTKCEIDIHIRGKNLSVFYQSFIWNG